MNEPQNPNDAPVSVEQSMERRVMILIEDWHKAWRFLSVKATAVAAGLWSGWLMLTQEQQLSIAQMLGFDPAKIAPLMAFGTIALARIIAQPALATAKAQPEPQDQPPQ